MSLDDKLREISFNATIYAGNKLGETVEVPIKLTDEAITQIKQAFTEAGWVEIPDAQGKPHLNVMTGQEWYKRWEDEMQKASQQILSMTFSSKEDVVMEAMNLIDAAAKAASGIDNLKENT